MAYEEFYPKPTTYWHPSQKKWVEKPKKDGATPGDYYPTAFCDPAIKSGKDYCLATVKAMYWNNWNYAGNAFGNSERARYIDNRNWSNGRFDVESFVGGKKPKNNNQQNPLMKHLDFDPVTEQSKYRDIVVGYMEELDFDILATTINPMAAARRENFRLNELAILRDRQSGFSQQVNEAAGTEIMPRTNLQFPVSDEQELNMLFQLGGFKEIAELQIELGNQIVQNDSDWEAVKKLLLEDAFDTGRMSVDIVYDADGRLRIKYVDQVNLGVEDFRGHYLQRPSRIWYIELKSVQELLTESNGQFTHEEARTIAMMFSNKFGNPSWGTAYQSSQTYFNTDARADYFYYGFKVPVMKCYWEEMDTYKIATYTDEKGNIQKRFTDFNATSELTEAEMEEFKALSSPPLFSKERGPGGESLATDNEQPTTVSKHLEDLKFHRYYQATWILNTQYIYNYGRVPFETRDPYNARFALCPLKHYRITNQPLAERIKPLVKKIYLTWKKVDNEVARKKPSGYQINVKALENISLGQGQTFTVKHAIEMWNETGDILISDEAVGDEFGRTRNKVAITPLSQQGFVEAINAYMILINMYKQQIVDLTGINEFMDGTNPNAQVAATVAKIANQGAKNSMSQIAAGMLNIAEKSAIDISGRMCLIMQHKDAYEGYADALGSGIRKAVSVTKAVLPHRFGIKIQARPTANDRAEMKQAVYQAFSNLATPEQGGLWVTDALRFVQMIDEGVNYKVINLLMAAAIKQKLQLLQQQRMELIQKQVDGNNQQNQNATQAELQVYGAKKQIDMMYEQFMTGEIIKRDSTDNNNKTQNKLVADTHKSGLKMREKLLDAAKEIR